jgi:uncharacterized delta-60 repeat protein
VDGTGNVYVTGESWNGTTDDYATVKYNSAGTQLWVATYNEPGNGKNHAVALAVDGTGNVYVTGNSGGGYATVKYNSAGTLEWAATYNGAADYAVALAVDGTGNVYVTGYSGNNNDYDFATFKYNSIGIQEWIKTYNGPGENLYGQYSRDYAVALAMDGAGNVYVTGSSDGSGTASDYATIKYDAFGVEQWVTRHDEPGHANDRVTAIAIDSSGNIYVTGYSYSINSSSDYLTIKYDATGVRQWIARYGSGDNNDYAAALAVDGAGNVYVTGYSEDGYGRYSDYVTVKYNSAGIQEWVATYNGPGNWNDHAVALAVDGAGGAAGAIYVTGTIVTGRYEDEEDDGYWITSYATIKYNSAGSQQWVATYDEGVNYAKALAVDSAGNVYVTGFSGHYSFSWTTPYVYRYDYATVKYNPAGIQEWVNIYGNGLRKRDDQAEYEYAPALAVDRAGNVYISGSSWDGTDLGYATIKYNTAGVQQWVARDYERENYEGYDYAKALAVDDYGNVYVTGDGGTVKYNSIGIRQWATQESGHGNDIAIDGAGNVYLTASGGTVKYNSTGTQEWETTYEWNWSSSYDYYSRPVALALDAVGNVYMAGTSIGAGTGYDFVTIKYTQIIADAGPDKQVCSGGSIQIGSNPTGSGGNGGPYTFSWTPTTSLNDPTAPNPIASPVTATTYTVTVTETATGAFATDEVTVIVPKSDWSVAHIVDVDDVIFGINQDTAPRDNRGLALSHNKRFLFLGYNTPSNNGIVRKIDLSISDPANNHSAVVAQLKLPPGTQPAWDIATDDKGRVYLALGSKIEIYNSNLTTLLHTISGFTACQGVAVRRENGAPVIYATDCLDKTLERFVVVDGAGVTIASSSKTGLDGDGEVLIVGASRPRGVDIVSNGTAWIADRSRGKIYRVNSAGRTVDSTAIKIPMDIAIDEARGEAYVSQYTRRTLAVLSLSTGKIKRTLAPPAADLNVDLDGKDGSGALCGIDVGSCQRVYVANERGRSLLTGNTPDSPFSNVGDDNDETAADTDPVLAVTGNVLSKSGEEESEGEESVIAKSEVVTNYGLAQNYPNPFNPSTMISFALPEVGKVTVKVYNETGQLVHTLVAGELAAGRHQLTWNGRNQLGHTVAAGVYFYRMTVVGKNGEAVFAKTNRMTMMK